jgi:quinol monooxygenase YgiN
MIYLLAHLKACPGAHPELMAAAKAMIAATRAETGCILYDLNISITDPQSMIFVEAWKNREALVEHFDAPHMAVWRKASEGYFTERKIEVIHPEKVEAL